VNRLPELVMPSLICKELLSARFCDLFWVESVRVPDSEERNRLVGDHSVDRLVTDLQKCLQLTNGQGEWRSKQVDYAYSRCPPPIAATTNGEFPD